MDTLLPGADALFEQAACGLLLTDADGLILRANATLRGWLGYEEDELAGKLRMAELLTMGARLFHHTHCLPMLQDRGAVAEIQIALCHRDGRRLPVLVNIVRCLQAGRVVDQWAVFQSADRHAYERELLAARRAAEAASSAHERAEVQLRLLNTQLSAADRRKDEFLATLSHELRNPLAPMRNALDVMKLKEDRGNAPALDGRLLQAFDRQLRHLTHLVDDLMEVSRITQGRMQLRRAPVELGALVQGALQDLAGALRNARHTLRLDLAGPPLLVDGDATRLSQVIVNLLNNAIKYTPDGGIIELRLRSRAGIAELTVRDSGIGIPASKLESVFEMFSQLEPALDRAKGGLGIGLALVRGIVELHGGGIQAASAGPGRGSEFTVRLPLLEAAPCAADAPAEQDAQGGGAGMPEAMRVLVVDDNLDAAEALTMALGMYGCETRVAHTAQSALALAPSFGPDAVLLDIGLPDLNGYELARRLRKLPGGSALTVIATTGWGQDKDRQRALEAGCDHHLTKPIDVERLRGLLGQRSCA
ncbi:ATP-binding protein [Massilia aerilata]|uniref:histidine kinase n=1 Tax=Massilia aerilata TaxID=453817 RepID=A0ABW0S1T1_9BURK